MRMSDWSSDVCSSDLPAADCPTGFTNAGVIANLRNCSITGRINNDLNIPKRAGTIYSLVGRVDVGTDVGGDGAAVGGKGVTLSVDPGVVVFGSGGLDFLVVNRGSKLNAVGTPTQPRSEEHTSELQSIMR